MPKWFLALPGVYLARTTTNEADWGRALSGGTAKMRPSSWRSVRLMHSSEVWMNGLSA